MLIFLFVVFTLYSFDIFIKVGDILFLDACGCLNCVCVDVIVEFFVGLCIDICLYKSVDVVDFIDIFVVICDVGGLFMGFSLDIVEVRRVVNVNLK